MNLEKCEFRLALTRPDKNAAIGCFRYCGLNGVAGIAVMVGDNRVNSTRDRSG